MDNIDMKLNNELFHVSDDEFSFYKNPIYHTLELYPHLGILEREIGLIKEIINIFQDVDFINVGLSHGGYVPIKLLSELDQLSIIEDDVKQLDNLSKNCLLHDPDKKIIICSNFGTINGFNRTKIIRIVNSKEFDEEFDKYPSNFVILTYCSIDITNSKKYSLSNSNLLVYISLDLVEKFENGFRYYLDGSALKYDNLIHLCMIVKDAGDGFREILEKNLEYIDEWTILDTGSSDNTVAIIKNVLKNKKGTLYQEPFINFRDSRNRCLVLAGTSCKFTIMLDDTYILNGNVRNFLETIRSDQFADSYNIFVKSSNNIYGSNRIVKSEKKLRYIYKIHEIINNDNNVVVQIPIDQLWIDDISNDYMKNRTKNRKESDLKLLFETLVEYPNVPRTLYYIAETYVNLENWDKAFKYAKKRTENPIGYSEEITESYLIMADIAYHKYKWDWDKCEKMYLKCFDHDKSRSDSLYAIANHYLKNNDNQKAFQYLKQGFNLGIPSNATSNLRFHIYNKLIPYHLTLLCYQMKDYSLGEKAAALYLKNNSHEETIVSFYKIFKLLNKSNPTNIVKNHHKILCFAADGGFKPWSGSSINNEGVGGAETYIIEMSKNIAKLTNYDVYVFCKIEKKETFENVKYRNIDSYVKFLDKHQIDTCIISRFSEYIPVTIKSHVDNIYLVVHDLTPSGNVIPKIDKLKGIFCMSDWHKEYFLNFYPSMKDRTSVFPNGININNYPTNVPKIKNSFIYSSFPNRGLINLLKMFPRIKEKIPNAILNVFCDTKHYWTRSVANEEMEEIERMMEEQKDYVINHGWVQKDLLTKYFLESEYWLYPCTFQETFCVTALEAAASNTLVICNDLAALKDTVADRGIVVPGNASTNEWQDKAITELIKIINSNEAKNKLVQQNRKWAETFDWMVLSKKFVDNYIGIKNTIPNIFIKYYGPIKENIKYLCNRFSHCKKVLEVGPGRTPFQLSTHFVDHINNDKLQNVTIIDITKQKLPFVDNEFDLVYCRHVLEDIHDPEFVINELFRVAKIVYIETPSPFAELSRQIDGASPHYRGYIHHRYIIWVHNNILKILPKYPIIEYAKLPDYYQQLENPYYWNTYFIWNKRNGMPSIEILKYDIDYNLHTQYDQMLELAVQESTQSIKTYVNNVIMTGKEINYASMLNWSSDIPLGSKQIFTNILDMFQNKKCRILEIGTYAGTSIISMLKYLPDATATVIDMWENYGENKMLESIKQNKIEEIFKNNLIIGNMVDRVRVMKGDSKDILVKLLLDNKKYDFIYVDGSHKCLDCYSDMILSWELLESDGVLAVDDYLWNYGNCDKLDIPYYAINHFIERYKNQYQILDIGYRVFLTKN